MSRTKNYVLVFIVIALVAAGSLLAYSSQKSDKNTTGTTSLSNKTPQNTTPTTSSKSNESRLLIGDANARTTITEYIDFKCPNCAKMHENVGKQLRSEYIDKKFAAIHIRPIAFIGPDSRRAAEGAYCANDQAKFTHYHDAVFEYMWIQGYNKNDTSNEFKDILTTDKLIEITTPHGIDGGLLRSCLDSTKHKPSVNADLKQSEKDGVTGTPHVIIGGKKVVGPQSYSTYKTLLEVTLR
jgi:protein-disulfide isomerase